jgi:hypothetical protein
MLEWSEKGVSDRTTRPVQGESVRHQLFTGSSNLAEEALYWFISAPALVYLLHLSRRFLIDQNAGLAPVKQTFFLTNLFNRANEFQQTNVI